MPQDIHTNSCEPFIRINKAPFLISPALSGMLDCARWIAAMLVMTGHLRDILFANYNNVVNTNAFVRLFYFLTGFGHIAVIIFFVMSGFLVGGSALEQYMLSNFSWSRYLIKRISRIYIVFFFALLFGGLLDTLGLVFFNQLGIYNNTHNIQFNSELTSRDISQNLDISTFLGNIAMLQTIKVSVLGSNGPLWSLANEFWYYLLFPALLGLFFPGNLWPKLISISFAAAIIALLPTTKLLYFSLWLLGTLIRSVSFPKLPNFMMSLIIFLVSLFMARTFGGDSFFLDLLIAITFALVLNALHKNQYYSNQFPFLRLKFHKFYANFSYSLYAIHFPLTLFLVNALNFYMGLSLERQPDLNSLALFIMLMLMIYSLSYYAAQLTENHTKHIRNHLFSLAEYFSRIRTEKKRQ